MADTKVPDMTGIVVASDDVLYIVDTSDTTDSDDGSSKKIAFSTLSSATETLTNKTIDGDDNTLQDIPYSAIKSTSMSGSDATVITGTKGTSADLSVWNADGDLVDGPTPPSGAIVGISDTQTLTNKTLTAPVISTISNTGVTTLFTATDTVVGKATTDVLTNKTVVQKVTSYTPDAAGTATLNVTTGGIHAITMPAGNITIAISNEATGQCFMIEITQDGTGSRTVTWFTTIKWAGDVAPTLTTTGAKRDTFGFRVTGTDTYDGYIVGQNV